MHNSVNGIISMRLTDPLVRTFQEVKNFSEHGHKIGAIDFSSDGKRLASCESDVKIEIYDCDKGSSLCTIRTQKYGGDLVHFDPKQNCVIHNSTKVNHFIRYLSLDRTEYLRYFMGHTQKVNSLAMSPQGNFFLSGSMDHTVRLWDLNVQHSRAVMQSSGPTIVAYDPEGIIFAAGVNSEAVKLYDIRSFDKGPFLTFNVGAEHDCEWTGMKFSADGKTILISTNGNMTRLIDAYTGALLKTFRGPTNKAKIPMEASFSPDSQLVFIGGADGRVHVWSSSAAITNKVCEIGRQQQVPVQCVKFNPQHMMLATAGKSLAFWLPRPETLLQ